MAESAPIALPTALLVATAAVACAVAAACAYLLLALVVVEGHGGVALQEDAWAAWCGAAACACGTVAALIALTRGRRASARSALPPLGRSRSRGP